MDICSVGEKIPENGGRGGVGGGGGRWEEEDEAETGWCFKNVLDLF